MVRTREFDPNVALERAMYLFWARGYNDTSMSDIVEETGVSRYGLYNVFGNKRELFIKALRRYGDRMIREVFAELGTPGASLETIVRGFGELVFDRNREERSRGCMFCNTATEVAPHDEFIAEAMRERYAELAKRFEKALRNAKRKGEIRRDADVEAMAFYLVGMLQALAVMARVGMGEQQARTFVETALRALR